jgi:prolyl-tRNA synthetase
MSDSTDSNDDKKVIVYSTNWCAYCKMAKQYLGGKNVVVDEKNIEEDPEAHKELMDKIGGTEMRTSVIQSKEVWEKSNRWDDKIVDNWFKTKLKNGGEVGLSFTNEEAYANILKQYVNSYKDLPLYPYDFKNIFRNEIRSKSGILRGREFYWKALYSFSKDEADALAKNNSVYKELRLIMKAELVEIDA